MADFLSIIADDGTFQWSPTNDDTGAPMAQTTFELRIITNDVLARLRREHTKKVFDKRSHGMVDQLNDSLFVAAMLDHAIVSWSGIKNAKTGEDVPCTPAMKALLPETVKSEVISLCAAKEAGATVSRIEEEKKRCAATSSGKPTSSAD